MRISPPRKSIAVRKRAHRVNPADHPEWAPGAGDEALVALAPLTGDGVIRCDLPGANGPPGMLARWRPASRSWWEGRTLTALVAEASGQAVLPAAADALGRLAGLERDAVAVVRWTAAWPGELGHCEVSPPEYVSLDGVVTWASGEPVSALVFSCGGETALTDDSGRFRFRVPLDVPCVFQAMAVTGEVATLADLSTMSAEVVVHAVPGTPPGPLALVVRAAQASGFGVGDRITMMSGDVDDVTARVENAAAAAVRLERQASPLAQALEDEALSESARALLQSWADQERADFDQAVGHRQDLEQSGSVREIVLEVDPG